MDDVFSMGKAGEAPAPAPVPATVSDDKDKVREADYQRRKGSINSGGVQPHPSLLCPLSHELMRDPVTLSSGITYDREAITAWFAGGGSSYAYSSGTQSEFLDAIAAFVDS